MKISVKARCGRINKLNYPPDSLAYIGDAVFELLVRTMNIKGSSLKSGSLHKKTVALVNAEAQAKFADMLQCEFSEDEIAVYKRGRNTAVHSMPKNAKLAEYCKATGLEAVFGYLYLTGNTKRLEQLFDYCMEGRS